jgi:cytochrome c oxidase subunit 1
MLSLNGMSVVLAVLGGAMFIVVVVGSILFGRKLGENEKLGKPMITAPPADEKYHGIGSGSITIPGTLVMVFVFLAAFALYYFINWKFLGETWGLS